MDTNIYIERLKPEDYRRLGANNKEGRYGELTDILIRERYSMSQELAILRQRDVKPEEFAEYNAYAEECKEKAKQILGLTK